MTLNTALILGETSKQTSRLNLSGKTFASDLICFRKREAFTLLILASLHGDNIVMPLRGERRSVVTLNPTIANAWKHLLISSGVDSFQKFAPLGSIERTSLNKKIKHFHRKNPRGDTVLVL